MFTSFNAAQWEASYQARRKGSNCNAFGAARWGSWGEASGGFTCAVAELAEDRSSGAQSLQAEFLTQGIGAELEIPPGPLSSAVKARHEAALMETSLLLF